MNAPVEPRFWIARVTDDGETFTQASWHGRLKYTSATAACEAARTLNRYRDEQDMADGAEYCAVTEVTP